MGLFGKVNVVLVVAAAATLVIAGCNSSVNNASQLERVAKDWSLTIRASQIIPVYPLTQDLQPGDIFITDNPIAQDVALFESKGFLPLENHVGRLKPTGYPDFYPFQQWPESMFPMINSTTQPTSMPTASFPSYSFTIQNDVNGSLGLPIHGVPVGLSILGAHTAHGEVTIADASTYGVDRVSLDKDVKDWASKPDNKKFLADFAPYYVRSSDGRTLTPAFHYLRVVSRVYMTKRLDVSVFNDDEVAAGGTVGLAQAAALPSATTSPSTNYTNAMNALNSALQNATTIPSALSGIKIGGSLQVAALTDRSVSLVETLSSPVVIGYIGFDYPIFSDQTLGTPTDTFSALSGAPQAFAKDANTVLINDWLKGEPAEGPRHTTLRTFVQTINQNADITDFLYTKAFAEAREKFVTDNKIAGPAMP